VIRRCSTPGCGTLTLGKTCLACEQKEVTEEHVFLRGRPYATPAGSAVTSPTTATAKSSSRSQ
jgi:hypothetical protein